MMMIKAHSSTFNIKDSRFSWENPFLFYDVDSDGYTEMAIRLVDDPLRHSKNLGMPDDLGSDKYAFEFSKRVTLAQLTFDLDNDNGPSNELDFDMSLKFFGEGFDYSDQVHKFTSLRGLPESDRFIHDPRWRQLTELAGS